MMQGLVFVGVVILKSSMFLNYKKLHDESAK